MAHIGINFDQFLALEMKIVQMRGLMDDLRPEWAEVAVELERYFARTFEQEGPGWAQLAEATVRERRRLGYGARHPILVREGDLMRSYTSQASVQMEPHWFWYVSSSELAGYHQTGTKHMPARPAVQLFRMLPIMQRSFEDALIKRVNQLWHERTGRGTFAGGMAA